MLKEKALNFGNLRCIVYDFERDNDVLAAHVHEESATHITICCKGKVLVKTAAWEKVLEAGNIIEFFAGQQHSIHSLEHNSRIINIPKHC
jgi:quercetin dioxygenase-like cupin family protein